MLHYRFYRKNASSHYVYIDFHIAGHTGETLRVTLPAWRPGRYEAGNFAKNVKKPEAFNSKDEALSMRKISKDSWEVRTNGARELKITYSYYSAELNAGSCYSDESQLYINPVHCCLFVEGRTNEKHTLALEIPGDWKVATSLALENGKFTAGDFDELADSPFMASARLLTHRFKVNDADFFLHFNGECKPDFEKMERDFTLFAKAQVAFWEGFPFGHFHFLFQVLPYKFYHGVEHKRSTVIAIGPGYALNAGDVYEEVLGVSSHELFHVWNVKTLRPAEMLPYDFTRENFARTGYVYEGFTTYYGDKFLLSSAVFTLQQYFKTLEERLLRHFHNYGRYNLSVADSSWDTWLDGYAPGAPYRKTSIYDEGCLVALMLDVMILQATGGKKSLREVCRRMWGEFGNLKKGYTGADVRRIVSDVAGKDMNEFFDRYVDSPADYDEPLNDCLKWLGIELQKQEATQACESLFGFKATDSVTGSRVSLVAPYSPAWKAGLFAGDEIIAVNGYALKGNLNHWLNYFNDPDAVEITAISADRVKIFTLRKENKGKQYFFVPKLKKVSESENFKAWLAG